MFVLLLVAAVVWKQGGEIVTAAEVSDQQQTDENEEDGLDYEKRANSWRYRDGHLIREESPALFSMRAAVFEPWTKNEEGQFINSDGVVIEGAVRKGIDVSEHNGLIDWAKVKADGIDFAIIRCGYGDDLSNQDDKQWLNNIKGCEENGIPYGIYIYSYAETDDQAVSEAQHVLRLIEEAGASPEYPVYYDLEDVTVERGGKESIIRKTHIFCNVIRDAGYKAGIYANLYWWNTYLTDDTLNVYERWVAQ